MVSAKSSPKGEMHENIHTINSNVFASANAEKIVHRLATSAGVGAVNEESTWYRKDNRRTKTRQHANGDLSCKCFGNADGVAGDCRNMAMKVALPSFWPALFANIGICTLLLGYIFIGSFVFLKIENSRQDVATTRLISQQYLNKISLNRTTNALTSNPASLLAPTALIFESDTDRKLQQALYEDDVFELNNAEAAERQRTVENIWEITVSLNILYKENWTRLAALELSRFQNYLMKRLTLDLRASGNSPGRRQAQHTISTVRPVGKQSEPLQSPQFEWRFSTAFLYSLTLVSTVGYGTLTPHTALGRMVTIAYATLGIPLMLIYLSSIGSVLGKLTRAWCTRTFCCCLCPRRPSHCCGFIGRQSRTNTKKGELQIKQPPLPPQHFPYCYVHASEISPEACTASTTTTGPYKQGASLDTLSVATFESRHSQALGWSIIVPVFLCLLLLLGYIIGGSIVISLLEKWPLIDSIYFCFMSLTTIGFCDLLPGTGWKSTSPASLTYPANSSNIAVWFCAAYIFTGLTLISTCVNMLHEEILWRMRVVAKLKTIPAKESKKAQAVFYGGLT